MPEPDVIAPAADAYAAVKARVLALDEDAALVLLAWALDPGPRPIRTATMLTGAGLTTAAGEPFGAAEVARLVEVLAEAEFVVRPDRLQVVDPRIELAASLSAYARFPERGRAVAEALLGVVGYAPPGGTKVTSTGRPYRDWNYVYDYDAFPLRTRLLLLADRYEDFRAELHDINNHHEWRVPARKAEAIAAATEPLRVFDYALWGALSPLFRLKAFEYVVTLRAHWSPYTAQHLDAFLADDGFAVTDFSDFDEALLGFGASLSGPAFRQNTAAWHVKPRAGIVAAVAAGAYEQADRLREEIAPLGRGYAGFADMLSALLGFRQNERHLYEIADRMKQWRDCPVPSALAAFKAYVHWSLGNSDLAEQLLTEHFGPQRITVTETAEGYVPDQPKPAPPLGWMMALCVYAWTGLKPNIAAVNHLLRSLDAVTYGVPNPIAYQHLVRGEIVNALASALPGDPRMRQWRAEADALAEQYDLHYLLALQPVPEAWEYALRVIKNVAGAEGAAAAADERAQSRLIWVVDFEAREVLPREQKRGKRGWSKGRRLGVQELVEYAGRGRFGADDDRAIGAARRFDGRPIALGQRYGSDIRLEFGRTLYHLDGHPRVYVDDAKRIPLELVRAKPQLYVEDVGDDVRLSFVPASAHRAGYHYEKETPTRYRVYEVSAEQARLARAIGRETVIPHAQRAAVEERIDDLRAHVHVAAAMELEGEELPEITGDTRPCAQLLPYGVAYKLELYSRPLPDEELYLRIGQGQARSAAMRRVEGELVQVGDEATRVSAIDDEVASEALGGERVLLIRDLEAEQRAAEAVIRDCPTLRELGHTDYEWTLDDDFAALRVLLELRALQQEERISVEHPKGEKLRLVGASSSDNLRIQIRKERDWFEVSGSLTADEGKVVSFRQLLAHLRNGGGEFVELSEGEFLAITTELRARLEQMEGMLQERQGAAALPLLAAPAFADLVDDFDDLEVDEAWRATLTRIAATEDFEPTLPVDFQGELRDYQLTGYRWLRRLAEWGVGGCLADDMGLGKTVQALALLVARQEAGPALVIAPASVTRNWAAETARFAPTLTAKLLATSADVHVLHDLGPRDVLLVSYGLLSFVEAELLEASFATIVLDEAQAIKNPATKRAKLIFKLDGELRIATTGTPIENHLGELWSLFRYLNPGLLGSRSSFNERFAGPIRREGDTTRADALRRLVRPFVLRRRKEEVLKELPPKTEVNLTVELTPEERALYEALRREAVDAIDEANPNAQRMIVLQQLTRLRQAACHPKLVRPKSTLASAKLALVGQTILELLDNGHKALIFSQFVRHLKLVEAWVQAAGLRYSYLDGSTPGGKRQQQVERFQGGEAELFLISLKAGGTGLNLTAADYVLHLDPWWNPAAEDQASDRAHRIGQQRPVTVYRFVSAGTIEERILALHAEKRDLADQILEGTDGGSRLSVGEVVALLRDGE